MKWKVKHKTEIEPGYKTTFNWFAWYPVKCEDDHYRWLEEIKVVRTYYMRRYFKYSVGTYLGYCNEYYPLETK